MFNRQDLPKLYHLDDQVIKQDNVRKTCPVSTSKLISTNETIESNELIKQVNIDQADESGEIQMKQSIVKSADLEFKNEKSTKTNSEFDLHTDERISDLENKSELDNSKDLSVKEESNSSASSQHLDSSLVATTGKRPNSLNMLTLLDCINELKNNKSRVTKISLEKCFQRRNTSLPRTEISEFLNKLLNDEVLEKIKYRDYYGVRLKASYKNGKHVTDQLDELDSNEDSDKLSLIDKSSFKSSINDQDTMSNLDNLSECSSNVNSALNELNDELDDEDGSGYNTKKNSLKRCSPTIRYLLRTAPEDGVSPDEMLKSLQTKRLLILYDVKKFIWLMKTYFVDKGICEQLSNGNYKSNNDEEISNLSVLKPDKTGDSKLDAKDDEINLFADEKFSDNEHFDSEKCDSTKEVLIKRVNRTSNHLTVQKVNDAINKIDQGTKNFDLYNILRTVECVSGLGSIELAAFVAKCCNLNLIERCEHSNVIMYNIERSKLLEGFDINDCELRKIFSSLKILMKNTVLSPDLMLIGLQKKFKLLQEFNLVLFNDLIRNHLLKEGFLQELPDNQYRLASDIILDETSNASNQSTPNPEIEYNDSEMESSNPSEKLGLKRKIKCKDDSTLRRPTSQRKKIKKSLGPDFLDPSGLRYENLRNLYEDKCEICLKNPDKNMIDCRKCKFKAHRQCLNNFDLAFKDSFKRFECEACRVKCNFCNRECEELINNLVTCKKCSLSYHANCLINKPELDKTTKNCTACEKTFFKYLMNKEGLFGSTNKADADKQNSLELDLNEASNSDINVQSNILEQVPTLVQLKEIEMAQEILGLNQNSDKRSDKRSSTDRLTPANSMKDINQSEVNSINDESNDSNQSNVGTSSPESLNSNLENTSSKNLKSDEETLVQKYRKLFQAYDVHQQVKITKEQFNTLKSLNSYSNGKNPADWTVDDVTNFISNVGFPEESLIFKKEEIDGKSLLLLRRNDVLTGLSMHLGPALKIYSHIYKLQASSV